MLHRLTNRLSLGRHLQYWFWGPVAITLAIFLLKFSVTGFAIYGDGLGYFTPLRSLLFDGNLQVANEYQYYADTAGEFSSSPRVFGPIPQYSKYTLGMGVVLLPFYALGHGLALTLNLLGDIRVNGMSWPYELCYCLGSITLGIISLVVSYRFARRYFSPVACAIATGGVWFASPLSFYLLVEVSMSHAVSACLVAVFLAGVLTRPWRTRWGWQIGLGGMIGLAAWVRPQDILFLLVPLVIAAWKEIDPVSPSPPHFVDRLTGFTGQYWRSLLVMILAASVMQLPQIVIYLWQFGGVDNIPYLIEGRSQGHGSSFHWFQPALWQVLVSGYRGLFTWHPLTLLATVGLVWGWRQFPRLNSALLLAFVTQVYFIAAWWSWWQGASVGGRMFSNCVFLWVFGLALLWEKLGQFGSKLAQRGAVGTTVFLIGWNGLLVLQYQTGMIPPEAPITLVTLYGNQFQVIPQVLQRLLGSG